MRTHCRNVLLCACTEEDLAALAAALAACGCVVPAPRTGASARVTQASLKKIPIEGGCRFVVTAGDVVLDKFAATIAKQPNVRRMKLESPVDPRDVHAVAMEIVRCRFEAETWPTVLKSLQEPPAAAGGGGQLLCGEEHHPSPIEGQVFELVRSEVEAWIADTLARKLICPAELHTVVPAVFTRLFETAQELHTHITRAFVLAAGEKKSQLGARVTRMAASASLRSALGEALVLALVRQLGKRCDRLPDPTVDTLRKREAVPMAELRDAIAFVLRLDRLSQADSLNETVPTRFEHGVAAALAENPDREFRAKMERLVGALTQVPAPASVATSAASSTAPVRAAAATAADDAAADDDDDGCGEDGVDTSVVG